MNVKRYFEPSISQEAVDYQKDFSFFQSLTKYFETFKEIPKKDRNDKKAEELGWSKLIMDYTGVTSTLTIQQKDFYSASVEPPLIDRNHTFLKSFRLFQKHYNFNKQRKQLEKLMKQKGNQAYVDRSNGKVGGLWSKLPVNYNITNKLIEDAEADELAAIMLHEIGHTFSYFETIYRTTETNIAIETAVEEVVGTKDPILKVQVIEDLKANGYLSWEEKAEKITKLQKDDMFVLLLTSANEELKRRNGEDIYNQTSFEQQADQFATRMGAGKALIRGLAKLKTGLDIRFLCYTVFCQRLLVSLMCLAFPGGWLMLVFISVGWAITDYIIFGPSSMFGRYDYTKDRMKRIKNEMIGLLKKHGDDKAIRETCLRDLEAIEDDYQKAKNDIPLLGVKFRVFQEIFTSIGQQRRRQQALEDLMNNQLFVVAYQLKEIKS